MKKSKLLLIAMALAASAAHAATSEMPADNSGVNERDRSDQTLTPEDQSQSKNDIALAAKIRRAVVKKSGISITGKNIKIIALNDHVTLRGPVKSEGERALIEKTVRKAAGKAVVDSQLEIK